MLTIENVHADGRVKGIHVLGHVTVTRTLGD